MDHHVSAVIIRSCFYFGRFEQRHATDGYCVSSFVSVTLLICLLLRAKLRSVLYNLIPCKCGTGT